MVAMATRFTASRGSCCFGQRRMRSILLLLLLFATTRTTLSATTASTYTTSDLNQTEIVTETVTESVDGTEVVTISSSTSTTVNYTDDMTAEETTPDLMTASAYTTSDLNQTEIVTGTVTESVDGTEVVTISSSTSTTVNYTDDTTAEETTPYLMTVLQTEIVTEVVTEYVEGGEVVTLPGTTVNDIVEETTLNLVTGPTLVMRFTISNKIFSEIEDPSEKKALTAFLVDELKPLYSETPKFHSVTVLKLRNGSIIVDVQLEFTDALNVGERDDVVQILYEKVVLNGTLGALQLQDLKLVNADEQIIDINDACDIRPCLQPDMKCIAKGTTCTAHCGDNKGYCLNHSICQPNNDYILCKCKKDFFGYRCDKKPEPPGRMRNENAYIGIIAAAAIAVVLLLIMIVGCGYKRLINRGKESDTSKLFPAENSVALEMLDEPPPIGGVACQTIESFLLTKYMKHGVPPRPGFQHEIVQTNDSFLMAKAQQEREANNAPPSNTPNGMGDTLPPPPASSPMIPTEQDGQGDQSGTEPLQGVPTQGALDEEGISNEAFVEDEGDIVPTAEVAGEDAIGKKIIKV